jgi:hypothetical protein
MIDIANETIKLIKKFSGIFIEDISRYDIRKQHIMLEDVKCVCLDSIHTESVIYLYDNGFLEKEEYGDIQRTRLKKEQIDGIDYTISDSNRYFVQVFIKIFYKELFKNNENIINIHNNNIFYTGDSKFTEEIVFNKHFIGEYKYFFLIFRYCYITMSNKGIIDNGFVRDNYVYDINGDEIKIHDIISEMKVKFRDHKLKQILEC